MPDVARLKAEWEKAELVWDAASEAALEAVDAAERARDARGAALAVAVAAEAEYRAALAKQEEEKDA